MNRIDRTHRHYVVTRGVHCFTISAGPVRDNGDGTVTILDHAGNAAFRLPRASVKEVVSEQEARARREQILATAAERN